MIYIHTKFKIAIFMFSGVSIIIIYYLSIISVDRPLESITNRITGKKLAGSVLMAPEHFSLAPNILGSLTANLSLMPVGS